MPAEEAGTCDDQVPGKGKLRAGPVPAAQPRDERADEEERCSVRAERVNRTDPAFGARQFRPVAGACESRRHGRQQTEPGQQRRSVTGLDPSGEVENGCAQPASGGYVGERRMQ